MLVAHATAAHTRHDIRIFRKECISVAEAYGSALLVVSDGKGPETLHGVRISDAGRPSRGRLSRMLVKPVFLYRELKASGANIVHIHDPELPSSGFAADLERLQGCLRCA